MSQSASIRHMVAQGIPDPLIARQLGIPIIAITRWRQKNLHNGALDKQYWIDQKEDIPMTPQERQDRDRRIIDLRNDTGMSTREIAAKVGCSLSTVARALRDAEAAGVEIAEALPDARTKLLVMDGETMDKPATEAKDDAPARPRLMLEPMEDAGVPETPTEDRYQMGRDDMSIEIVGTLVGLGVAELRSRIDTLVDELADGQHGDDSWAIHIRAYAAALTAIGAPEHTDYWAELRQALAEVFA